MYRAVALFGSRVTVCSVFNICALGKRGTWGSSGSSGSCWSLDGNRRGGRSLSLNQKGMWFQETPDCQWSHSEFPGAASGGEESQEQTSEKLLFSHSYYCLGQNTHKNLLIPNAFGTLSCYSFKIKAYHCCVKKGYPLKWQFVLTWLW